MKKVAVILSGCGFLDGAEITEAISTLVAIGQHGAEYACFAPDKDVSETNHLTQQATGQTRNVLREAPGLREETFTPSRNSRRRTSTPWRFPVGLGRHFICVILHRRGAEERSIRKSFVS